MVVFNSMSNVNLILRIANIVLHEFDISVYTFK